MRTVLAEPLQEEDLLQGEVEEGVPVVPLEDVFVKFGLVAQHLQQVWEVVVRRAVTEQEHGRHGPVGEHARPSPRFTDGLPPVEMWDERLDDQQQEGFVVTNVRLVYQHGVRPAAHVQEKILEVLRQGAEVEDLRGDSVVWFAGVERPGVAQPLRQLDRDIRPNERVVDEVQALLLLVPEGFAPYVQLPKPLGGDSDLLLATFASPEVPRHGHEDADEDVERHHRAEHAHSSADHGHVASPLDLHGRTKEENH